MKLMASVKPYLLSVVLAFYFTNSFSQSKNNIKMSSEKVIMIVLAQINPKEKEALDEYLKKSAPIFKSAGGIPINKYKIAEQLIGNNPIDLVSIMEFPSHKALKNAFESSDYKQLLSLREKGFLKLEVFVSNF